MATGFIGEYFEFKCLAILQENIQTAWKKLSNPQDMFKLDFGSPLLQKVLKDGFMNFAKDYAKNNVGSLVGASMAAIKEVTGRDPFAGLFATYDSLMFMFVGAMSAKNDYLLRITQEIAESAVNRGNQKILELQEIRKDFIPLYNVLVRLAQGTDELYDLYVGQLRLGLTELYKSEKNVELVWNTLQYSGYFLNTRYENAKTQLTTARALVQPDISKDYYKIVHPGNYDEEFDYPTWKTEACRVSGNTSPFQSDKAFGQAVGDSLSLLARSAGIPATEEQFANIKLVSKLTSQLIKTGKEYLKKTFNLNIPLLAFPNALSSLQDKFPDFMLKMLRLQFENFLADMREVRKSMASHLNGSEDAISGPVGAQKARKNLEESGIKLTSRKSAVGSYKPVLPVLSTMSLAWTVQLNVLDGWFDSISVEALSANNLNKAAVDEYKRVVGALNAYDDVISGGTNILSMENGVEQVAEFEQQMLLFLSAATIAMYTFSIDDTILALGRQILQRTDTNLRRTQEIVALMKGWRDYPLPGQEILDRLHSNIINTADLGGFDKFKDKLSGGDFTSLLTLDATNASSIGVALAVISLLASCASEDGRDTTALNKARDSITEDLSLFNFSLSINFDLNIFEGIRNCIVFKGLSKKFDLEELICNLVKDLGITPGASVSNQWDSVQDSIGNLGEDIGNSMGYSGASPADPQP